MLRLAFDFIITWRETRTRPNAYREFIGAGTGIFIALSDSDVSGIGRRLVGCDGKAVEL